MFRLVDPESGLITIDGKVNVSDGIDLQGAEVNGEQLAGYQFQCC